MDGPNFEIKIFFDGSSMLPLIAVQETWFDLVLVTGILLFVVLLEFGSTWGGPDFKLSMEDSNKRQDITGTTVKVQFSFTQSNNDARRWQYKSYALQVAKAGVVVRLASMSCPLANVY